MHGTRLAIWEFSKTQLLPWRWSWNETAQLQLLTQHLNGRHPEMLGTVKEQGPSNCIDFHKGTEEKRGHQGLEEGNKMRLCFCYIWLPVLMLFYIQFPLTKNYEEWKWAGCQREKSSKARAIAGLSPETRAWVPCPCSGRFRRIEQGQWSQSLSLHGFHWGVGDPSDFHLAHYMLKLQIHV